MKPLLAFNKQTISHEFNTALTGILSNAALLNDQALNAQQTSACIQDIYHSSQALLNFMYSFVDTVKQTMLMEAMLKSGSVTKVKPYQPDNAWLTVLLVEDEPIIQRVHGKMLQTLGCHVDLAENGHQALEKLKSDNHYDIIFMDIGLPGMNGIEAVTQLRQLPMHKKTPVIGLTAYQLDDIQEKCNAVGFNQVMTKPVSLNKLKSILQGLAKERIHYAFI